MQKSRTEYEELIRNSMLFNLNKETQTVAYKREALKLVEYLYLYLMEINEDKYAEYGLEITQTAQRCIKNYSLDAGDFLNYFNAAMAKEYRKVYALKKTAELHGGAHISEQDQRIINKFIKISEYKGAYELSGKAVDNISAATGISSNRIIQCILAYQNSFLAENTITVDNEEKSLFDFIPFSDEQTQCQEQNEQVIEFLAHINKVFISRQERQKPLLAKLLTAKITMDILEDSILLKEAKKLDFFDECIFEQTCQNGKALTARDIASYFEITEQSVSRTYKVFLSLL